MKPRSKKRRIVKESMQRGDVKVKECQNGKWRLREEGQKTEASKMMPGESCSFYFSILIH